MSSRRGRRSLGEVIRSRAEEAKPFTLKEACFDAQFKFISDTSRFKTACTSRRAGKSGGIIRDMVGTCLTEKNIICLYVTITSRNARNIIWGDLKRLLEDYKIPVKTDDTRMTVVFKETGSEIRVGGAKDESQIENYRGWKLRKAYVDEAQSFRPYLRYFIDDILLPSLRDLRGDLMITGTPGPLLSGPFYEYTHSEFLSHHHWTAFDNPFMHNIEKGMDLNLTLAEERQMRGITETDPSYIRETFGKWIEDLDSLVYKFSRDKNRFGALPDEKLEYIFGIDIGYEDSDAIAVIGYSHTSNFCYLVEEVITGKQDITSLSNQIRALQEKYKPVKMVMDAGALGKKIQEEIRLRQGLVIEAADKHRKFEFITLLNDDLRTGKFKAYPNSRFEQDCFLVQWDKSTPGKLKISDSYHTDIGDAVLYGWRECRHYFQMDKKPPKLAPDEYMRAMEEKEAEQLAERLEAAKSGEDIVNYSDLGVDDSDTYDDIF